MIFTDRTITVRKGESRIDEPIVVYRGDYELEVRFTILNSRFKFMSGTNMIESEKASYGQLAILTPYGGNIFSDIVRCNDGSVTFVLTAEMLNQIEEVGLYSFQIRLMDYNKESRVSIPPIEFGIEVREPIASEDHDNSVNNAIVGYSIAKVVDPKEENVGDTFDESGNYNKTKWETGDRISEGKLNKIEDAIDKVNENEINNTATLSKRIDNNFNVLDATKADKNEIFTMANMGQDVKEAMTGGSVAVVGNNSILSNNIVNHQVTFDKIGFRHSEGLIKEGTLNLDVNNKKLVATGPAGVFVDSDPNRQYYTYSAHEVDLSGVNFGRILTIYFNKLTLRYEAHYYGETYTTKPYDLILIAYYWKNVITSNQDYGTVLLNGIRDTFNIDFALSSSIRTCMLNGHMDINTTARTMSYSSFNFTLPVGGYKQTYVPSGVCYYQNTTRALNVYINAKTLKIVTYEFDDVIQNTLSGQFLLGTLYEGKMFNSFSNNFITIDGVGNGGWHVEDVSNTRKTTFNEAWNNWERGNKYPIMFLGDSTTDGNTTSHTTRNVPGTDYINPYAYPYRLEQLIKEETGNTNVRIYNAGFSGKTASWAYENIETIMSEYGDAKMVGISYGINDSLTSDIGVYYDNFKASVERLITYFIGIGIQPFLLTTQAVLMKNGSAEQCRAHKINSVSNNVKKELANKYNLELIDITKPTEEFMIYSAHNIDQIQPDTLHFSDIGHRYESELYFSKLCPRVINSSDMELITIFAQNVKSDISTFERNMNSKFKYIVNYNRSDISDLIIMDMFLFNNEKKQISLNVIGDVIVRVNNETLTDITNHKLDLGLHHIQVITRKTHVYFEGIELHRI